MEILLILTVLEHFKFQDKHCDWKMLSVVEVTNTYATS